MNKYKYDIIIIGAGPAGIFAAYELIKNSNNLKIAILEKGEPLANRECPIISKKVQQCINCNNCSIMNGFMGAGAFSDGKFNISTEYGGWLNEHINDIDLINLIYKVDNINMEILKKKIDCYPYLVDDLVKLYSSYNFDLKNKFLQNDLYLLEGYCRHLGTDYNLIIGQYLYEYLSKCVDIFFNTNVNEFMVDKNAINNKFIVYTTNNIFYTDKLIVAPGRSGAEWLKQQCNNLNIKVTNNQIDIGVRVEIPSLILKDITDKVYELKIKCKTKQYEDIVRTFCMNPNGYVVTENVDGIVTVNGHSFHDSELQSDNTNFALLVSNIFTEPFNEPFKYGKAIASLSNMLSNGIIVQRFGDLIRHRRTNEKRLRENTVKPTLNATPGDLSLVLPKRYLDNIIYTMYQMNNVISGIINDDTLLYGVETKFYSAKVMLDNNLETSIKGLYCIGDGSGWTRSLSYASASGIYVADNILKDYNKSF